MKVAILAGGLGTRLAEETDAKPKPMVEIGGYPILWHIMMHYHRYGFRDFVIALGYKGDVIKQYISNYSSLSGDVMINVATGEIANRNSAKPDWVVELVETGLKTQTGGRIKRIAPHIGDSTFMLTWGDGVSNVNLDELLKFHRSHGKLATMTVVRPPARFGYVELNEDRITKFTEKPQTSEGWINGAFFVLEPEVVDYIDDDKTHWERGPLERLARDGQLVGYRHSSFWQCMDTLRDKRLLEKLWKSGAAPWMKEE